MNKDGKKNSFKKFTAVLVASTMLALGFTQGVSPVMAETKPVSVAENPTTNNFNDVFGNNTKEVGRIWTDKSVSKITNGDEDTDQFEVTLSALSSASNISTLVTSRKDLDVIFILDRSGSMKDQYKDDMEVYGTPEEIYNQDPEGKYYIKEGWFSSEKTLKYDSNKKEFTYDRGKLTSEDTVKTIGGKGTQVYKKSTTRRAELKKATYNFINQLTPKDRLSIVSFASDSTIDTKLKSDNYFVTCDDEGKSNLKKIVNEKVYDKCDGGTYAEKGFENANTVSKHFRPDAEKVVIFFSDGEPGGYGFEDSGGYETAVESIKESKSLKENAKVYSVALLDGTNPETDPSQCGPYTRRSQADRGTPKSLQMADCFMHCVSSNYLKSTGFDKKTCGPRNTKKDEKGQVVNTEYYKSTAQGQSVDEIFQNILVEVNSDAKSGYSTEVSSDALTDGYVIFTDHLGKYMELDGTPVVRFAGEEYPYVNGSFEGTIINSVPMNEGKTQELKYILFNNSNGIVEVKIPAALLPVKLYNKSGKGTLEKTGDDPIQISFKVKLNDQAKQKILDGSYIYDEELNNYVNSHKVGNAVAFYSNDFSKRIEDGVPTIEEMKINTRAQFQPNETNSYYYFTSDEVLYSDDEGTVATSALDQYYKKVVYYNVGDSEESVVYEKLNTAMNSFAKKSNGKMILPKGTPYLAIEDGTEISKGEGNVTDTMTKVSFPKFHQSKDMNYVNVYLGNNGRVTYELPGSLKVSKKVNNIADDMILNKEFNFTVKFENYGGTSIKAKKSSSEKIETLEVKNHEVSFTLKDKESIEFLGLPSGVTYEVIEVPTEGYTSVMEYSNKEDKRIQTNVTDEVVVTNTFKPEPVVIGEDAETAIRVHKSITGRKEADEYGWLEAANDSFTFTLSVTPTEHVQMEKNKVVIDSSDRENGYTESFGKITIDQAGTYTFTISEEKPDVNKGFAKAPAKQTVVVSVTDNPLTGKMDVSFDSSSTTFNFVNEYKAKDVAIGKDTDTALSVQKVLENRAWKADDTFTFTMSQSSGKTVALPDPIMMKGLDVLENEKNASKEFGKIVFEEAGTYEFVVTETMENAPGVHAEEESQTMKVIVTDDGKGQLVAQVENASLTFTNIYEAEDVDVDPNTENESDPVEAVAGFKKVLTGRNWAKDESFTFELVDVTGKSEKIIDSKVATQAQPVVQFENLTYTLDMLSGKSSKTFKYEVREQKPDGGVKDGLTYSSNVAKFEVTVKDAGQGQLTASLKSTGGSHVFANAYEAKSVVLKDCLQVTKKLTGREWKDSDRFTFRLEPIETYEDGSFEWSKTECTISSEDVDHKASFGNVTFFKPSPKGGYQFKVVEVIPNDDTKGMSYQSTPERITFKVTDDGEGQLHASVDKSKTDDLIFENTYSASDLVIDPTQDPDGEGTVGIQLEKVLTGREWKDGDSFLFEIEPLDGAPATTKSECTITGPHQKFDFGVLRITKEDMKGESRKEFRYKVSEVIPENPIPGITYESDPIIFRVLVTDNGEGFLVAGDGTPDSGLVINVNDGSNKGMFTNVYVPAKGVLDGSKNLAVTKQIEGRDWLDSDTFTFTLKANKEYEGVTLPESLEVTVSKENRAASFGDISFTKEGTYEFTIYESSKAKNGMTNAADQTITIVVEDNLNGKLVAKVKEGSALMPFVNKYAPEKGTDVDPNKADAQVDGFKKVLTGRDWAKDEQFQFALKDESGKVLQTITVDEENPIAKFDKLVYGADVLEGAQSKEFKYTIEEVAPKQDENGIQYDRHKVHLTVTVKDMKDGTLKASVTQKGSHEFTNVYDAKDVDVDPNTENGSDPVEVVAGFKKVLTGRDWTKDESFTFELVDVTGDSKEVIESKKATKSQPIVQFNSLTYSKDMLDGKSSKIFKYEVREQKPDGGVKDGLTYSNNVAQFEVTVKDAGQGQLSASLKSTDGSHVFENVYVPGNVPVDPTLDPDSTQTGVGLPFEKVLEGRNWKGSDAFEFELIALDEGAPMPENSVVTITGPKQKFDFGTIVFDADDMKSGYDVVEGSSIRTKDFHYQVVELPGSIPGIQYDANRPIEFTITVVDDGSGQLSAKVAKKDINGSTKFTNVFDASRKFEGEDSGLRIVKVLEGHDMSADQFAFDVVAQSKDAAEKIGKKEKGDSIVVSSGVAVAANTKAVMIPFENMEFDGYDIDKEFEYVVKEQLKDVAGYTYDKSEHVVKIVVQEQKDGTLLPVTYVDGKLVEGIANVVFNNVFEASGTLNGDGHVNIEATKTLSGRNMDEGEFRFDVINVSNGVVVSQGRNLMAANGDVAKIVFDPIEYDMAMLTKDAAEGFASHELGSNVYSYQYKVVEDSSDFAGRGISAVTPSMNVVVNVKVMEDASLDFEVVYPEQSGGLAFKNNYNTDVVSVDVNGSKRLTVPENSSMSLEDIAGQYQFVIEALEPSYIPEEVVDPMVEVSEGVEEVDEAKEVEASEEMDSKDVVEDVPSVMMVNSVKGSDYLPAKTSATNDAAGNVHFGTIQFDQSALNGVQEGEDGCRTITFNYVVSEVGQLPGITNDGNKQFSIVVTDDGKGGLTAALVGDVAFEFNNTYAVSSVSSCITDQVRLNKVLTGRELLANEFVFRMEEVNGSRFAEGTNDAKGNVVMGPIAFDKAGEYEFRVFEKDTSNNVMNGISYDGAVYDVSAIVTDNKDGTLRVEWDAHGLDSIEFKNEYVAKSTSYTFGAMKVLSGRDLMADEFEFVLKNLKGQVVDSAKNDKDGFVQFDSIEFKKPGTYTYTLSEVKGDVKDVTYDDHEYKVVLEVVDNGKGNLEVVRQDDAKIVFKNAYVKSEVPKKPESPKKDSNTGLATNVSSWMSLMAISGTALAGISYRKRKSNKK